MMETMDKTRIGMLLMLFVLVLHSPHAQSEWADWWQSPEQRALSLHEKGDHETLINNAPNARWKALGHFNQGDFQAASEAYAESQKSLQEANDRIGAQSALYNQAVSDVMAGQYQAAIDKFDAVLSENPTHADAEHNRDIAQQLLELEQRENQQQDSNSDSDESGEQDQSEEPSSDQGESSDQNQEGESESDSQSNSENDSQESEGQADSSESDTDESQSSSEEQQQQEEQAARDALAAEAQQNEQMPEQDEEGQQQTAVVETEQPLTESEQATEQMLRRIPDDPRGLLRRKLEQSHMNEFPEVRDARDPW